MTKPPTDNIPYPVLHDGGVTARFQELVQQYQRKRGVTCDAESLRTMMHECGSITDIVRDDLTDTDEHILDRVLLFYR